MIALLPVSRYRVRYLVASGRPYSFFERFILEAVGAGHTSLDALERTFRVHRRALIEGLVTLIQAGWIAIDRNNHELLATAAGRQAIGHPDQLPESIVVVEETDFIIGERAQGQVAKGTEVTFSPRSELRKHIPHAAVIPTSDLPHPLDPGVLIPLLRINESEWVRSCGPIDIVRDGADFVVVDVDTSSGVITGIPSKWVPLLRDELVDRARSKERQMLETGTIYLTDSALAKLVRRDFTALDPTEETNPDEWPLDSTLDHMLLGSDHQALLENWLETARSYVGIVSVRMDYSVVSQLESRLRAAVSRGVLVDVIWGGPIEIPGRDDAHKSAFELLKKIEWDSRHSPGRGRLVLGRKGTGSNARILIGDVGETFEAVVGSYDWLSSSPAQHVLDLSLLFRERGPVARIARLVADLAASDDALSKGSGMTRLRHAAADLDRQTAEVAQRNAAERETVPRWEGMAEIQATTKVQPATLRGRLVVGRQHHAILPILADEVHRRLVIAGYRWGPCSGNSFKPLMQALAGGCPLVEVRYGLDEDPGTDHDSTDCGR
ncbi:MAG: hypothetical protein NTY38_26310 [Acidobacteria bacterium]|nr:hypothetical protein [Acidobacteriota bacterium]